MKIDKQLMRQLFLYGIIGGGCAMLDMTIFTLLFIHLEVNEFIANAISSHAGIFMSFFLNSRYNFKKTDRILYRAASFYLTGLFGIGLSTVLLWLGGILMLPVFWVKFTAIFIVAAVQFIINKLVAFRK